MQNLRRKKHHSLLSSVVAIPHMDYITYVVLQESERMVALITLIRTNLAELDLGLKGDLTMSEPMERLANHMAEGAIASSVNAYLNIHHLIEEWTTTRHG